jgi:hypothetical protein
MNKKVVAGIAAGLFTLAALVTVGAVAYNAGARFTVTLPLRQRP